MEGAAIHPLAYIRYRARLIQRHSTARSRQSSDAEKKREARCLLAEVFKFDGYEDVEPMYTAQGPPNAKRCSRAARFRVQGEGRQRALAQRDQD